MGYVNRKGLVSDRHSSKHPAAIRPVGTCRTGMREIAVSFFNIPFSNISFSQSGREDSNLRLHGPEPCALPGCATPRITSCLSRGDREKHATQKGDIIIIEKLRRLSISILRGLILCFLSGDKSYGPVGPPTVTIPVKLRFAAPPKAGTEMNSRVSLPLCGIGTRPTLNRDFSAGLNISSAGLRVCRFPLWNIKGRTPP